MNSKFAGRFGRMQKLKSRKQIQELFTGGNSLFAHPVKLVWMVGEQISEGQASSKLLAGVSVSKRNFKKATDRNRIKRLLRESYRLNKPGLETAFENKSSSISLFLIYVDKTLPNFDQLQQKVAHCLTLLKDKTRHLP